MIPLGTGATRTFQISSPLKIGGSIAFPRLDGTFGEGEVIGIATFLVTNHDQSNGTEPTFH